jgi:hypothetical protein
MQAFFSSSLDAHIVVIWWHNESTFYANDWHDLCWVHKSESTTIKAQGKGASQMVGDFMSPDYGFMRSKKRNPETG